MRPRVLESNRWWNSPEDEVEIDDERCWLWTCLSADGWRAKQGSLCSRRIPIRNSSKKMPYAATCSHWLLGREWAWTDKHDTATQEQQQQQLQQPLELGLIAFYNNCVYIGCLPRVFAFAREIWIFRIRSASSCSLFRGRATLYLTHISLLRGNFAPGDLWAPPPRRLFGCAVI